MESSMHLLKLIGTLTLILIQKQKKGESCFVIFYDFKAAYDMVSRSKLFAKLKKFGV